MEGFQNFFFFLKELPYTIKFSELLDLEPIRAREREVAWKDLLDVIYFSL